MATIAPPDLEGLSAEEVLAYAVERFHPRLYVACSFQKEASVIMDLLLRIQPEARFFTVDTGVLFEETYRTRRALEDRYGVQIDAYDAKPPVGGTWAADSCCSDRKVAALREALSTADAWVTGLRREQSPGRAGTPKLHWDELHGLWKVNPLADWSERDVWNHISANDIPYNPLHDQGFDSIGCVPCTVPGRGRDGRWAGSDRTECGIHG